MVVSQLAERQSLRDTMESNLKINAITLVRINKFSPMNFQALFYQLLGRVSTSLVLFQQQWVGPLTSKNQIYRCLLLNLDKTTVFNLDLDGVC